jgi:hypothetical protein
VIEQEEQLRITPSLAKSNFANEVNINLLTLQHIGQVEDHAEEHHARSECGGQNTYSLSEGLPQMNHMEYKRMVVEVQTMVDEARNREKGKSAETVGQSADDQSRQMDIWEDNVSMILLTGGHLEIELYDTANIKRVKKRVMKYHWSEDTLFFQNLVVRRLAKQKKLIEKIHEEIR